MPSTCALEMRGEKPVEKLIGIVERVIYYNEANGYAIFLLHSKKRLPSGKGSSKHSCVCVGTVPLAEAGSHLLLYGEWVQHDRYGQQFRVADYEEIYPTTEDALLSYLTSGFIHGIGTTLAKRIIKAFGEDTITVLDTHPEKLLAIQGISEHTYATIRESWFAHTTLRDLCLFLQPYGISPGVAGTLATIIPENTLATIKANPYLLTTENRNIPFETADAIARDLCFPPDSPLRVEAFMMHLLRRAVANGHVYLPKGKLLEEADVLSGDLPEDLSPYLEHLLAEQRIVCDSFLDSEEATQAVYLPHLHKYETGIAKAIAEKLTTPKSIVFEDPEADVEAALSQQSLTMDHAQKQAIAMATQAKIMIITGGPGTGKTTIIRVILDLFTAKNAKIAIAAPTGRAARKIQEATGYKAKTIHRLLEFGIDEDFSAPKKLSADLLIVDESSMIDCSLMYALLNAAPAGCTVIFVGDVFQLPSIGPGQVLADLIASKVLQVVTLHKIFRQAAESAIVRYAHDIKEGIVPLFQFDTKARNDFYFMECSSPEEGADIIVDLVTRRLPAYYHFNPKTDIQVLSPMHMGPAGVTELNARLQTALNPNTIRIEHHQVVYVLFDKVMQLRNNYEKDVFNGDMGTIIDIDKGKATLTVQFDDKNVLYAFKDLEDLIPAYAISIHKSQGSEYSCVIVSLMSSHWYMLERNLLYTAVTRARDLVVIVGDRKALFQAIANKRSQKRLTHLAERLTEMVVKTQDNQ